MPYNSDDVAVNENHYCYEEICYGNNFTKMYETIGRFEKSAEFLNVSN